MNHHHHHHHHHCIMCNRRTEWTFAELGVDLCSAECQRRVWRALDPASRRRVLESSAHEDRRHSHMTVNHALRRSKHAYVRTHVDEQYERQERIGDIVGFDGTYLQRPQHKDEDRFFVRDSDRRKIDGQRGKETDRIRPIVFNRLYAVAVYDGHGGNDASRRLADNDLEILFDIDDDRASVVDDTTIADQFKRWDRKLLDDVDNAQTVGSTATLLLVTKNQLKVAYVGDSLALVYVRSPERRVFVVPEHDPYLLVERRRIKAKGGWINMQLVGAENIVVRGEQIDVERENVITIEDELQRRFDRLKTQSFESLVNRDEFEPRVVARLRNPLRPASGAGLAMTRSFGDFSLKRDFTSADRSYRTTEQNYDPRGVLSNEPSFLTIDFDRQDVGEVFVVIASDGMWDFFVDPAIQVPALIEAVLGDREMHREFGSASEAIAEELFAVVTTGWDNERSRAKAFDERERHDDTTILVTRLVTGVDGDAIKQ